MELRNKSLRQRNNLKSKRKIQILKMMPKIWIIMITILIIILEDKREM